jgi:serine/threonine-protein kinase RsbW
MASTSRPVELRLPADPNLLRVARVTVAAVAASLPFTLQDVEDLRIAVDELSARAIEGVTPEAILELRITAGHADVTVVGRVPGAGPLPPLHPVAAELIAMTDVEQHEVDGGADRAFEFTKRAQVAAS